jgi:hypothetical protein
MGGEPLLAAAGRAMLIGLVGVLTGELTIGVGVGVASLRGFAALAVPRRLGQTTGLAEVWRELSGPPPAALLGPVVTLTGRATGPGSPAHRCRCGEQPFRPRPHLQHITSRRPWQPTTPVRH